MSKITIGEMYDKGDKRPKKNCWAPGGYMCNCTTCNRNFIGDKRAVTCASCAYSDQANTPDTPDAAVEAATKLAEADSTVNCTGCELESDTCNSPCCKRDEAIIRKAYAPHMNRLEELEELATNLRLCPWCTNQLKGGD